MMTGFITTRDGRLTEDSTIEIRNEGGDIITSGPLAVAPHWNGLEALGYKSTSRDHRLVSGGFEFDVEPL